MIEEIIKLRGRGLSFRNIAKELNTTVGKIQNQWSKWTKDNERSQYQTFEEVSKEIVHIPSKSSDFILKLISPRKIFLFWEIHDVERHLTETYFALPFAEMTQVIRVYDVTGIIFNGNNQHGVYEIVIPKNQSFWFIKGLVPNRSYLAEINVRISEEHFFPIKRSNTIHIPRIEISETTRLYNDLLQFKKSNKHAPNWVEHVSTYSYYEKSDLKETKNG
jgi:uncharacterized protein